MNLTTTIPATTGREGYTILPQKMGLAIRHDWDGAPGALDPISSLYVVETGQVLAWFQGHIQIDITVRGMK